MFKWVEEKGPFRKECLEMGQRSSDDNTDESERTLSTVSAPTENESKVIGFAESLKYLQRVSISDH